MEFQHGLMIIHMLSLGVGYIGILQLVRTDLQSQSDTLKHELRDTSLTAYERAKGEESLRVNEEIYAVVASAISQCMQVRERSMDIYESQVEPLDPQYAHVKSH
jgi:hypothetical protein